MCFRLHLDWPVSRNPLANGLLSIFSFVIWSFWGGAEREREFEISHCITIHYHGITESRGEAAHSKGTK